MFNFCPENSFFQQDVRTGRNPEEVAAKMAAAQVYSDVIFLRGGHLSCRFFRKAPRTCQSDFNDQNKNNLQRENVLANPLGSGILW